ncbi:uncharacterized protein [Montipora capricornis]|uniref:uncharacterized protein isoform X2 n=1 Tax=Montipora capricornis TaxID=246305 RepID=UPI0035F20CB2
MLVTKRSLLFVTGVVRMREVLTVHRWLSWLSIGLPWRRYIGHNVKEIAHDCVMALKTWFQGEGIKNSFNSWHGTKGVARDMKKICSGTRRDEGIKWFTELSDKAKATKTHFYWAMRNNDGTAAEFQQYLLNVVDHYQGKHDLCHQDSRCKHAGYINFVAKRKCQIQKV